MSIENERYVSNRVDRIEHLEEVIKLKDKEIEELKRKYQELLKDYNELRDYR